MPAPAEAGPCRRGWHGPSSRPGCWAQRAAGVTAYRAVGPYGDGPFGAGYRRLVGPEGAALVHETRLGGQTVRTVIDERTRGMSALQIDTDGDGVFDTHAHVEASGQIRVERDIDADGNVDRWEYYDDARDLARGRMAKVGFSLPGDGVVDAWAFHDADGQVARVEVSTARDGNVDRWEHYAGGDLMRVETDRDRDGRVDAWSVYENGILRESLTDSDGDGRPDGDGEPTTANPGGRRAAGADAAGR